MKMNLLAALTVFLLAKLALAGGSSVGNGGNTIVCTDGLGQIISVELLDFYEARVKRGITPDLGASTISVDDKIEIALKRLEKISEYEATNLRYQYQSHFKADSVFLPGIHLVTVNDSDHLFIPAGCQQEQTAIQKAPEFPGDKLYNIDQDLWSHMDADNRAGLILHELFYRQAILYGHPDDSVAVRFLVSSIASAESIALKDFVEVFRGLKFGGVDLRGYGFKITPKEPAIADDGTLLGGDLLGATNFTIQKQTFLVTAIHFDYTGMVSGFKLLIPTYLEMNNQGYWFAPDTYISVNPSGDISWGSIMPQNMELKKDGQYDLHLSESTTNLVRLGFENGKLLQCDPCSGQATVSGQLVDVDSYRAFSSEGVFVHLAHPSPFKYLNYNLMLQNILDVGSGGNLDTATLAAPIHLTVSGKDIFFEEGPLNFEKNVLGCGVLGEDTVLSTIDNKQIPYMKGMLLCFDDQGRVKRAGLPPVFSQPPKTLE